MKAQLIAAIALSSLTASAQSVGDKILDDFRHETRLSGYIIGKATATDQHGKIPLDFDLRLVRASVAGRVMDVAYTFQMEYEGVFSSTTQKGPHIVDAWMEWDKYRCGRIKFGQFKRSFTFENPMNPWAVDFGTYSQTVTKLAGMSDRVGEHSSGGRDIGIQLQGDLFPIATDRHTLLHYQVGVFNGQGINHGDRNRQKDIIGGAWLSPIKGLDIAWFGWHGNYTDGTTTVKRNRWALSARYTGDHFYARTEYIRSHGGKISNPDATLADGWYAMVGYKRPRWQTAVKWDAYRDTGHWASVHHIYGATFTYHFCTNLQLQANYGFHDDRLSSDRYYQSFDIQAYLKF